MRAALPNPQDMEEVVDDAYHQVAQQSLARDPYFRTTDPTLFPEALSRYEPWAVGIRACGI